MFSIFLLIIIYIAFISLGLPDSMLGAAWPAMYTDLGVPISFAGFLTLTTCLGTVVSSLFYSGLRKRFRTETITVVSVLLTATALLLYSKITSFYLLLPAAFVLRPIRLHFYSFLKYRPDNRFSIQLPNPVP